MQFNKPTSLRFLVIIIILSSISSFGCKSDCNKSCGCTISAENVGPNSMDVVWVHECYQCTSWEVCWKETGFLNFDKPCDINVLPVTSPTLTSGGTFTLTGLNPNTQYKICVRTTDSQNACIEDVLINK